MGNHVRIGLVLAALLVPGAFAQSNDDNKDGGVGGAAGVRSSPPRRMTGLGGVRSQPGVKSAAPHRMSGLGGVRSQPGVKSESPRSFSSPLKVHNSPVTRPALSMPELSPGPGRSSSDQVRIPAGYRPVPVVGNGLTVSGSYRDGPFTLVFRTGALTKPHHHNGQHPGGHPGESHPGKDCVILPIYSGGCYGFPCWPIGSYYNGYGVAYGYSRSYDYPRPILGEPVSTPVAEQSEPMTPQENAAAQLRYGDSKAAIASYQAVLRTSPNDSESLRALGLSLIDNGQVGDGVAVIGMAYRSDSTLASSVIPRNVYGKHDALRGNLTRVSAYANREKSASAWLALAAFMQAEGREPQALAMMERAKAAGLENQIVDEMTAALSAMSGS